MNGPRGRDALRAFYGDVRVVYDEGSRTWMLDPVGWEGINCVVVTDLPGLDGRKLYVNRKILAPLRTALTLATMRCPEYKIESIACFNPRPTRPAIRRLEKAGALVDGASATWGTGLSFHSVAAAIDVNPTRNAMRTATSRTEVWWDIPEPFFQAFRDSGWTCGVDFGAGDPTPTRDPMHFQYGAL